MSVLFILIPVSLAFATAFLGVFIWAVRSGQFEDTGTPSLRLLADDGAPAVKAGAPLGRGGELRNGGPPLNPGNTTVSNDED